MNEDSNVVHPDHLIESICNFTTIEATVDPSHPPMQIKHHLGASFGFFLMLQLKGRQGAIMDRDL